MNTEQTPNGISSSQLSRRGFNLAAGSAVLTGAMGWNSNRLLARAKPETVPSAEKIPLGFDNFSIRANQWKADRLIEFAAEQKVDAILFSDLEVYENHDTKYLKQLKSKLDDAGIVVQAGTGGICPTSAKFDRKKWGSAEEHLRLGIRIAQGIGSSVFRCYLGSQKDRQGEGGIQKHIDSTIKVLGKVRSQAIDANVTIAVENHAGDMQAWELARLIEAAGKDFVGATIDSGNATWTLEHPLDNLEILGPYAVSSGIRDSTVWETPDGCKVAWNAIGEGQLNWKKYTTRFAELCPGVPLQLEIISGFSKSFDYNKAKFWKAYPDAKASHFARFLELARAGKEVAKGESGSAEYQTSELLKSIKYCKEELGIGLR